MPLTRSQVMRAIHSKDTAPEMMVRRSLFKRGFRYRLHRRDLPGSPDLLVLRYNVTIFVNGCFWHQHGCKYTSHPKTNTTFWNDKFTNNIIRDVKTFHKLSLMGYRIATIWECSLKGKGNLTTEQALERLAEFINSDEENIEI
ncbi:MAG: DNA mismatch endonuclease Vsr [Fibrobacter sp.]|nr:DNA mismatch endonuclease Vsr [Fibrobacter sp.]